MDVLWRGRGGLNENVQTTLLGRKSICLSPLREKSAFRRFMKIFILDTMKSNARLYKDHRKKKCEINCDLCEPPVLSLLT